MNNFLTLRLLHWLATGFCACTIVGIFVANWFRVLPSIGMAGLLLTGLLYAIAHRRIGNAHRWPVFAAVTLIFGLHVASGLYTEPQHLGDYGRDVVMQLPFLLLPLAFWLLPPLPCQQLRGLWGLFIGVTLIAALGATINYLTNSAAIHQLYLQSQVMPTEPDHIRLSLLVTVAIGAGVALLWHRAVGAAWRPWLGAAVVLLVLFLHLLAVRSGLMTFYALGALAVSWLVFGEKRSVLAAKLALGLLLLPAVCFVTFPTFRNKFYNTQEDVGKVGDTKEANRYSLVARVYSYRAALALWHDHKLVGVGKPDLQAEMDRRYAAMYPEIEAKAYILPHNQYIYNLAAYGALGLLVFCLGLFYPWWWARQRHAPLLMVQYVSLALSFLVEYTLETQIGVAFAVFFLMLALQGSLPAADPEGEWRPA